MKIKYELTPEEALYYASLYLKDREEVNSELSVELAKMTEPATQTRPNYSLFGNPQARDENKIYLIKLVRVAQEDFVQKHPALQTFLEEHPNINKCMGLADAKRYVESYLDNNNNEVKI